MNTQHDIVGLYEAIAEISGRMLAEARANRWDAVFMLGDEYHHAIEALRGLELHSREHRETRRELLIKILDDDASIRRLAMPELSRLSDLIGNTKRQHRVLRTYSGTLA